MKAKTKTYIILISIPIVVIALFIIFLKFYFTGDRLKSMVIPTLEQTLHRKIEMDDISLNIFPVFGINIQNLKVSNPDDKNFSKDEFFLTERVLINVKLLPLFKNWLDIKEISIKSPELNLEINSMGENNYTFTLQPEKKIEPKKKEFTSLYSILVNHFKIENAKIEYLDFKENTRILIEGYNQLTKIKSTDSKETLIITNEHSVENFSFGDIKKFIVSNISLRSNNILSYNLKNDVLTFDTCFVFLNQLGANIKGSIANLQDNMNFDLKIISDENDIKKLLSILPEEYVKLKKGISTSGNFTAQLIINGEMTDTTIPLISGKFFLIDGKLKYSQLPKSITELNLVTKFNIQDKTSHLNIEKFSFKLGQTSVSGNLDVKNFSNPVISLNTSGIIDLSEVKDYYPLDENTSLNGIVRGNVSLTGAIEQPEKVKGNGEIVLQNVTIATAVSQQSIDKINGSIVFNNNVIMSKSIAMLIGKSDLEASFNFKNFMELISVKSGRKPEFTINIRSNLMRTSDVMKETEMDAKETKTEKQTAFLLPDVNIDATMNVKKFVMEKFELNNLIGSLNYTGGIANLKNLSFEIFDGIITFDGKLDLRNSSERKFNLKLSVTDAQANNLLSNFTSFGNYIFGKFSMETLLNGSVDDTLGIITRTLNGNGTVNLKEGKLTGYALMQKIAEFTGLSELREVIFRDWNNDFKIVDGKIFFKDLKVRARDFDFIADGYQSVDGIIDMNLNIKVPTAYSGKVKIGGILGQLVSNLKDKEGKFTIPLYVTGHYLKPSISLNVKEQKRQIEAQVRDEIEQKKEELKEKATEEIKQAIDTLKQKGIEELKKKGEETIKKLFRKP